MHFYSIKVSVINDAREGCTDGHLHRSSQMTLCKWCSLVSEWIYYTEQLEPYATAKYFKSV